MALDDTFERRRRRRRRIRGPLTLVCLVALVTGAAWYGYESILNVPPEPKPRQVCATPKPKAKQHISAQRVTVNVYNASNTTGLAERTAASLRARGFTVDSVGNDPYHSKVTKVEVRGRAVNAPELLLVAAQLNGEKRKADGRHNTTVDIILGSKYPGLVVKAPKAMDVVTPIGVCITVTPTPVALP